MDSILLIVIALLILKRIPAGKKLGKGAKAGICVGIAAVVALVFWAMFFRSGSAPAAAASSESAAASETAESTAASEEATDGLFMELSQKDAGGWLGCHIYLMEDGTFSVAYDYTADNTGSEAAKGTYVDNGDGTLTLTAADGTVHTAAAAAVLDGGNNVGIRAGLEAGVCGDVQNGLRDICTRSLVPVADGVDAVVCQRCHQTGTGVEAVNVSCVVHAHHELLPGGGSLFQHGVHGLRNFSATFAIQRAKMPAPREGADTENALFDAAGAFHPLGRIPQDDLITFQLPHDRFLKFYSSLHF